MSLKKINYITAISIAILALIATIVLRMYWRSSEYYPSTDNAYVHANIVTVSPRVSGNISQVYVGNNQVVKQGQLLFQIDPEPFKLKLSEAEASLDLAKQNYEALLAQAQAAKANVAQQLAQLTLDQKNFERNVKLVNSKLVSQADLDRFRAKLDVTKAAVQGAKDQLNRIERQIGPEGSQNAAIRRAQTAVDNAKLELSYTTVLAPADGAISNYNLRPGNVVNAGESLFTLVENSGWWVEANFKETKLENIRPGQQAKIKLDMYPGYILNGVVDSISRGSCGSFSLLPPQDSSGNWVKVTQRFSVRINIPKVDPQYPLRVGASAEVTIDTKSPSKSPREVKPGSGDKDQYCR